MTRMDWYWIGLMLCLSQVNVVTASAAAIFMIITFIVVCKGEK